MKRTINKKKETTSRKSLANRLTAYSVMAGAALAIMPTAEGALVSTSKDSMAITPSSNDEGFVQAQQVQSQKVRHHRRTGMHVLVSSASSACSSSSNSGSGAGE